MLWKWCTQYASKFGKLSSGHRTGKGQFSFQSQRKVMPKNAQTTALLHSSHTLVSNAQNSPSQPLAIREPWTPRCSSWFQKRQRNQRSNCQHPQDHQKSNSSRKKKKISLCFIDFAKAFDCVDNNKLWKILKQMGIPGYITCLLRNLYAGQKATVRTGHGTAGWFQIEKKSTLMLYMVTLLI